jgi:hypothetical protein
VRCSRYIPSSSRTAPPPDIRRTFSGPHYLAQAVGGTVIGVMAQLQQQCGHQQSERQGRGEGRSRLWVTNFDPTCFQFASRSAVAGIPVLRLTFFAKRNKEKITFSYFFCCVRHLVITGSSSKGGLPRRLASVACARAEQPSAWPVFSSVRDQERTRG